MFMVLCRDAPGDTPGLERQRLLQAHLDHVETVMDRLWVAGPLRGADGGIVGSLLIVDAADEAEARALIARDPYAGALIWDRVEYRAFKGVAGKWVGGKAW
jgi:uncharacterized protein